MPNIFDYLEWRGDISFAEDPFNEVDNLILAELSYTDFAGTLSENGRRTSLKNAHRKFFELHSREEVEKQDNPIFRTPLLMDGMMSGDRFSGTLIADYINIIDEDSDMQMSAVTFILADGTAYVAFRGTDNTVVGWKEDLIMSYQPETGGQKEALNYLNRIGKKLKRPIRVGGHSKGGNFAVYASAFCDRKVQDKIIAVYSNDGQGFRHEITESEEYRRIIPKVISIIPDSSVVGLLLSSEAGTEIMVQSSAKRFEQHDGMTWQLNRNRFIRNEQSDFSRLMKETQKHWLSKIEDDERESFVESLFSILEATGADTFGEMGGQKLRSIERMLNAAQGMPREKQKELIRIVGELVQSGSKTMMRSLDDRKKGN